MHPSRPRVALAPPPPALVARTARSFDLVPATNHAATALLTWLSRHGFGACPVRSDHEFARCRSTSGALIILYQSGAVLVQGQNAPATVELLRSLAGGVQ